VTHRRHGAAQGPASHLTARKGSDPTASPTASVIICAYTERRWDDLVESVRVMGDSGDDAPFEIIVVIDHNPGLAARVRDEVSGVHVVENQGSRGLSGARNTGIAEARGDVVVFLDDDAVPAPGWLPHLLAPYSDEAVMGVGGAADAVWPDLRPAWFPAEFEWVVGCSWTGLPVELAPIRNLIGCNMSFRREVFDLVGGFREGIGRVGTTPLGCEETELCIRLRQSRPSTVLLYEPRARVNHTVSPDRIRWRYFRSRCHAEGLSKALVTTEVGSRDGLAAERAHTLKVLPRGVWYGLKATARGDRSGLTRAGAIIGGLAWTSAGYASGRITARRNQRRTGVGSGSPSGAESTPAPNRDHRSPLDR
jgi:GT2 family glycosyltransferase